MATLTPMSGILPMTNCFVVVPQDKIVAVETFGSFTKTLLPGLHFAGLDCIGACIALKSVSRRIEQIMVKVPTKTADNVFIQAQIAVQLRIREDQAKDALYKLSNIHEQLTSYCSDVIRSRMPELTLDEAFEKRDQLSEAVLDTLRKQMEPFGWDVVCTLLVDLAVNAEVMRSMNEISRQARLRDASYMQAEAAKIKTVKAAEGAADASHLAGQGIARQRGAIIDGLRASLSGGSGEEIKQDDITTLLLSTQYFETLKDIGSRPTSKTYYLPHSGPDDIDGQIRSGMLQGTVGLEYMQSGGGGGGGPLQQQMGQYGASPPRSRPNSPAARQSVGQTTLQITIPNGVSPGQVMQVQAPSGQIVQVQVPNGAHPGTQIQVRV